MGTFTAIYDVCRGERRQLTQGSFSDGTMEDHRCRGGLRRYVKGEDSSLNERPAERAELPSLLNPHQWYSSANLRFVPRWKYRSLFSTEALRVGRRRYRHVGCMRLQSTFGLAGEDEDGRYPDLLSRHIERVNATAQRWSPRDQAKAIERPIFLIKSRLQTALQAAGEVRRPVACDSQK